jgi:molecular chaperone DnaK
MFVTGYDNQREVTVEVYQGESLAPEENVVIGNFHVEGLSNAPAGNPVIIHFDLDLNGMLKVTATEKTTGFNKSVVMDTRAKGGLDLEEARRNIAALIEGTEAGVAQRALPSGTEAEPGTEEILATAKDLRKRGEALVQKSVNPDDAKEIQDLIHQTAEAIKQGDWGSVTDFNDRLSDLLFYMED